MIAILRILIPNNPGITSIVTIPINKFSKFNTRLFFMSGFNSRNILFFSEQFIITFLLLEKNNEITISSFFCYVRNVNSESGFK